MINVASFLDAAAGGAVMQGGAGGVGGVGVGGGYQGGYLSFQQQQQYHAGGWPPSCSLAKLQQMADAPQHHPPHQVMPASHTVYASAFIYSLGCPVVKSTLINFVTVRFS